MELFVHTTGTEHPELVHIEATVAVRALLVETDADGRVWIEDFDEEIDLDLTIEESPIEHHVHIHRGRCRRVETVVRFNGDHRHKFAPAKTIKAVHRWACGPDGANLTPAQAAAHVLARPGADHFLEDGVHIGSLADPHSCEVVLDLFPRERFAG